MAIVRKLQTNFNKGELSPQIEGRIDVAGFFNGASVLENFWIRYEGGIFRRYGTALVNEVKDSSKETWLLKFHFNADTAYAIEAGDLYFRFYRRTPGVDHTLHQITLSGVTVETAVPYASTDYADLQYTQSADVLYLVHGDYQQRKLSRTSDTGWSLSLFTAKPPPTVEEGEALVSRLAFQANTGTGIVFRAENDIFLDGDVNRVITFGAGRGIIQTVTSGRDGTIDILDDFDQVISDGPGTLSTSTVTLTTTVDHVLIAGDFVRLTSGAQSGEIRMVTVILTPTTATLGNAFSVGQAGVTWEKINGFASEAWTLEGTPQAGLTPQKKEPVGRTITLTADAAAFRASYIGKYIKVYSGVIRITEYTSTTSMKGEIESVLTDAAVSPAKAPAGTWTIEEASWSDERGWPQSVTFHQGRLWFGGNQAQPTTLWGSRSNDFQNFAIGANASDAVEYTIASRQVNIVRWLTSLKNLFIGDANSEQNAKGQGVDAPLGGDTIPYIVDDGDGGSMHVQPLVVQRALIFVQAYGRKLLEHVYDFAKDAFVSHNLNRYARHIGTPQFKQHPPVYFKEPNSLINVIRTDGQVACVTYDREEEVYGWSRMITDGTVESMIDLPDSIHGEDGMVMIAKRTISGAPRRFIEVFRTPNNSTGALFTRAWRQRETDCGKSGTINANDTTIPGFSHLEGKNVDVILNGSFVGQRLVTGGSIILNPSDVDPDTYRTYEAGLHYKSKFVSMRPSVPGQNVEGLPRTWKNLFLRMLNSRGGTVNGEDILYPAAPLNTVALHSGDFGVQVIGSGEDRDGYITIEQDQPYPMEIVTMYGDVHFGDQA